MPLTGKSIIQQETVQAGFFTPCRIGKMWDTWIYYHEGACYQFYLAGEHVRWDRHALTTSTDGVHNTLFDPDALRL